jgi:N-acetylmuramoyl-L-alanine amidase
MIEALVPWVPADTQPPVARPAMVRKYIPYGKARKKQMAGYAKRHYGVRTWRMRDPKAIVLHYTVSTTWQSAWNTFASNRPVAGPSGSRPEAPGTCTHFIVHTDGTILQLAPLGKMCRHAIGLNHRSIGIEFVEMRSARNILNRPAQRRAGVKLVRWLQSRLDIRTKHVIGHSMVNDSPFFTERVRGWRNDHGDWSKPQTRQFRRRL